MFIAIAKRIFDAIVKRKSHQNKGATWEINSCFWLKQLVFTHYID
jgi:hypothetical protein